VWRIAYRVPGLRKHSRSRDQRHLYDIAGCESIGYHPWVCIERLRSSRGLSPGALGKPAAFARGVPLLEEIHREKHERTKVYESGTIAIGVLVPYQTREGKPRLSALVRNRTGLWVVRSRYEVVWLHSSWAGTILVQRRMHLIREDKVCLWASKSWCFPTLNSRLS
jgi:hypothetical protein